MERDKDKDKARKGPRHEFEVAVYTKELERSLQRKRLQRQLPEFSDSLVAAASHGEEASPESQYAPPREDRAG
jgi:hypothetical protein